MSAPSPLFTYFGTGTTTVDPYNSFDEDILDIPDACVPKCKFCSNPRARIPGIGDTVCWECAVVKCTCCRNTVFRSIQSLTTRDPSTDVCYCCKPHNVKSILTQETIPANMALYGVVDIMLDYLVDFSSQAN